MPKPVLLTVDDDPEVLRAVERDLRKKYADRYRVVRADSGASAEQSLQTLRTRNEAVALLLVDQRMPEMSGVEFLNKAIAIYPDAKPLTRRASITTCLSRGILLKSNCIQLSMTCWRIGRPTTVRCLKVFAYWVTAGRRVPTRYATS